MSQHAAERSQVTEIFNSNANHPGISSATQWVQQWLDAVMRGEKTAIAAEDMRRLVDNGVAARDIVIEAASFFLYQQWNRHKFLNDDAVNMALSLAVLTLAPPGKKTRVNPDGSQSEVRMEVKAAPRKKVGRYIRSHLIDLFLNLQKTIEDNRGAAISTKAAMRSPLVFPAVLMATTDPTT